nr:N-acetylmuramoyl-L-alanine amidase [Clostridium sp. HBUAS56017]
MYNELYNTSKNPKLTGEITAPMQFAKISGKTMTVTGWAIAESGVKEVQIFVDGQLKGKVVPNIATPDIDQKYPGHVNGNTSGYELDVDVSNISAGYNVIIARTIANDGSIKDAGRTVYFNKLESKGEITSPLQFSKIPGNTMKVTGWAVADSGVKEVKIYVDGEFKSTVVPNKTTTDIGKTYSNYPNASTSGYEANVDISNVSAGNKVIIARIVANDGSIKDTGRTVYVDKLESKGEITSPLQFANIAGKSMTVTGWTIANSGVKEVQIYVDGELKSTVVPNKATTDIGKTYSNYPNASTSGYEANVDISNVSEGNKVIIARSVANDGSIKDAGRTVYVDKLESKGEITSPLQFAKMPGNTMKVTGWAVADSGVKEVKVYVDGELKSTVVPNKTTTDIGKTYSSYPNASTSGYEANVDISNVSAGSKVIIARIVANDGSIKDAGRTVYVNKLESKGEITSPLQFANIAGNTMKVTGWTIANSGVKEVQVYVDGELKSTVVPNKTTTDIGKTYSNYPNASTSGYEATIDISNIAAGNRVIITRSVANDGTIKDAGRTININRLETKGEIQSPRQYATITGNTMTVAGWTVADSGVKEVQIYVDGELKGTVVPNVATSDIAKTYSNYPNASTSGYTATVNISDITEGNKVIIARTVAKDGSIKDAGRTVFVDRYQTKGEINTPEQFALVRNNQLTISGWTIAKLGVKEVQIYVDGKYKGSVVPNKSTPDVKSQYPSYPNAETAGYETTVDISDIATDGDKLIIARTVSNDGTIKDAGRTFTRKTKTLIVLDPGHNYGGDYGADSNFNGVYYSETELNMLVAIKLQSNLQAQGYQVVMTRRLGERSMDDLNTSLRNRAILANDLNADLFISIHHNSAEPNTTARGSEVYYTERTSNERDAGMPPHNPDKFTKSRDLAIGTAERISANTGFANRGGKGDVSSLGFGLSVLRNTKMPAILVECGYISNPTEASLLANNSVQQATANGITQAVKARY